MGDVRSGPAGIDTADWERAFASHAEDALISGAFDTVDDGPTFGESVAPIFRGLLEPARYKGAWGGRGGAKSHFFGELAVVRAVSEPGLRAVFLREVQRTLRESVKLLVEDKIRKFGWQDKFDIRHDFIRTPGDGVFIFMGMQDHTADSIKSLEGFDIAWFEEAQTMTQRSLELLRPTIRKPDSELWFAWNPRHVSDPVDQFLRGSESPPSSIVINANWRDNPWFPPVLEEERQFDYRTNPQRYRHIWEGDYEPQAIGAIWTRQMIAESRQSAAPQMQRILVAIDPAISAEKGSNETGIIVAGLGADDRGYVLADVSRIALPEEWARAAIAQYDLWEADAIVIETNQGGDMCRQTIKAVRPDVRIIEVHASRAKHVRAEPISALYATGKISHVGAFPELEHQMCLITPDGYVGEGSPDRADALVWVFTSLFGKLTNRVHDSRTRFSVVPSSPRRLVKR